MARRDAIVCPAGAKTSARAARASVVRAAPAIGALWVPLGCSDAPAGDARLAPARSGVAPVEARVSGDRLAAFAVENQATYRIEYVIYRQRINLGQGWEAMEDRGDITQNHFDHVHVSFHP